MDEKDGYGYAKEVAINGRRIFMTLQQSGPTQGRCYMHPSSPFTLYRIISSLTSHWPVSHPEIVYPHKYYQIVLYLK